MTSVPAADAAREADRAAWTRGSIDVVAERARTVGAEHSHHFNAAGAALPSVAVVAAVVDHLHREELVGGYEAANEAKAELESVYAAAAGIVNAQPDEIALFDSASTALRVVIDALRPTAGMRIIASRSTYVSHALHLMTLQRETGVELVVLPVDRDRRADLVELERLLSDGRPTVVSIAHVPTSSGLVEPVVEVGRLTRAHGATYVLDATQTVGQLDIDVAAIGCDVLVTTGRKFLRAPRGTAFAFISRALCERLAPTAPDVRGSQWIGATAWDVQPGARRFETWEAGIAARLGLGVALREASARGMDQTQDWLVQLAALIRARLAELSGVSIADPTDTRSAVVTFVVSGVPAGEVASRLAEQGVRVVSVPATHGQWDLGDRDISAVVRASPHVYNDERDVDALVAAVAAVAG